MPNVYLTEEEIDAIGQIIEDVRGNLEGCGDDYFESTSPSVCLSDTAYGKMLRAIGKHRNKKLVKKYVKEGLSKRKH